MKWMKKNTLKQLLRARCPKVDVLGKKGFVDKMIAIAMFPEGKREQFHGEKGTKFLWGTISP
jgi:hypothetical protein